MFVVTIKVFKYSQKDGQQRIASKFDDNSDVIRFCIIDNNYKTDF